MKKIDLNHYAHTLAWHLDDALRGFIKVNFGNSDVTHARDWFNDLTRISKQALQLWTKLQVAPEEYHFRFPTTYEPFDMYTMTTEGLMQVHSTRKVHIALFPSLTRTAKDRENTQVKETLIFPATIVPLRAD